jgi:hypothetical protein
MIEECRNKIQELITNQINNLNLPLKLRIENKQTYSLFDGVYSIDIDLGSNFKLTKESVVCPTPVSYRYVRRGRRGSTHNELASSARLDLSVMVYTSADNSNTLARKLNHYLESNRNKVMVNANDIANIPFQDILFTNRINADALPLPPKNVGQRVQKSTRDAVCWHIHHSGQRSQWTVEKLNNQSAPVVFVDDITPESKAIAQFITVFTIPKCNKDLVLKKGMTLEQGKNYLLSKNKEGVVGLSNLPSDHTKVDVLKKFKRKTESDDLTNYLFEQFPDVKKEMLASSAEYNALVKKYPLITVLNSLGHYSTESAKIVINEINKQSKEDV